MNEETLYGIDGLNSRNDSNAFNEPAASAFGYQINEEKSEEQNHLDIHNSNSRLDKYLFYFSSKL